ncbi:MAG: alpha/beta fold hydrolase [Pseudomonadota bacterium]
MKKHTPLISLRASRFNSTGTIFCLPGAGDGITSFVNLTGAMTNGLAVYGLQPRGLVDNQEPYPSIEAMVNEYIDAILSKINGGPYYIMGHSFGGYVALSIAKTLQESGCDIAPVILLDVSPPENPHPHKNRIENLLCLVATMELASKKNFNLTFDTLALLDVEAQLQTLHSRMVANGLLPGNSNPETIRGMVGLYIANSHMEYWPSDKYEGAALYVNAVDAKENKQERYRSLERWRNFIPRIKYAESPGNHVTMLNNNNAQVLIKLIEREWNLT